MRAFRQAGTAWYLFTLIFVFFFTLSFGSCDSAGDAGEEAGGNKYTFPATHKGDQVDDYFGTKVNDPYRWLENINDAQTKAWIEAQNKFTDDYYEKEGLKQLRADVNKRLKELFNYERCYSPVKIGDYYVFKKRGGLQEHPVVYRQKGLKGKPEILIDPNTFSKDGSIILRDYYFSGDNKYIACKISRGGADWNEFFVIEADTGKKLKDHVQWVKYSDACWYKDGFFYSRYDSPKEADKLKAKTMSHKLYYHKLGTAQSEDRLVLQDKTNPRLLFFSRVTADERFLVVTGFLGPAMNLLYFRDLRKEGKVVPFIDKPLGKFTVVGERDNRFLVHTNYKASNFRVVLIDPEKPAVENWKEVLPEAPQKMEDVFFIGGHLIVSYLKDAYTAVSVYTVKGKKLHDISLPGIGTALDFTGEKEGNETFYTYSSWTTPPTVYRYLIKENKSELFQKPDAPFDPDLYITRQVFYKSKDGTRVPMFLVHKKGLKMDGKRPMILSGYGGYGFSMRPNFSQNTLSNLPLLEKDGVYAVACLRGGGEYGEKWHRDGMLEKKQNVFDDFIGAAEYLVAEGYTNSRKLGIYSGSNGGLLIGAVVNQRPELFGAAVASAPVLDMLRFHKFTIGWTAAAEYGSSEKEDQFKYIFKYSPLHNIKKGLPYPPVLVTTGDQDDRAFPPHAYKYIAELQDKCSGRNPAILRVYKKVGHAGTSTSKLIRFFSDTISFILYNIQ